MSGERYPSLLSSSRSRLVAWSWPSWYWMPVVSSKCHRRLVRSVHVRSVHVSSEFGVLNPDPNAASNLT